MGEPINDAIARSRVHHQLMPNQVKIEARDGDRLQAKIIAGLKKKGHLVKLNATSIVQAVAYDQRERRVFAASDPRKGGKSWGI